MAYNKQTTYAEIENYLVNTKNFVQISKKDFLEQIPCKRVVNGVETKRKKKRIFYLPTKKVDESSIYEDPAFVAKIKSNLNFDLVFLPDGTIDTKNIDEKSIVFFEKLLQGLMFELVVLGHESEAIKLSDKIRDVLKKEPTKIVFPLFYLLSKYEDFLILFNQSNFFNKAEKSDSLGPYSAVISSFILALSTPDSKVSYSDTIYLGITYSDEEIEFFKEVMSKKEVFSWGTIQFLQRDKTLAEKKGNTLFIIQLNDGLGGCDTQALISTSCEGSVVIPMNSYFKIESITKKKSKNVIFIERVI